MTLDQIQARLESRTREYQRIRHRLDAGLQLPAPGDLERRMAELDAIRSELQRLRVQERTLEFSARRLALPSRLGRRDRRRGDGIALPADFEFRRWRTR